jgi:hypothetical protein
MATVWIFDTEVKVSLSLIKHHVLKIYEGVEV